MITFFQDIPAEDLTAAEVLADQAANHAAQDQNDRAISCYEAALALEPTRTDWLLALVDSLRNAGRDHKAEELLQDFLTRRPEHAGARMRLAEIFAASERMDDALREAQECVFLDGQNPETRVLLGRLLVQADRAQEAVPVLTACLRRDPEYGPAYHALGQAWSALGETEKALEVLANAESLMPEEREHIAADIRAIVSKAGVELPASYVRILFDQYADRFDAELVERLGYTAPQALKSALVRYGLPADRSWNILDIGCGTGLMGVELQGAAKHLAGVDLSPAMVAKAQDRGIYDLLQADDAATFMDGYSEEWDLVVAADVLVYMGDLLPVFQAASRSLKPGGLFAATVERGSDESFVLQSSRRFAHSETYLRARAQEAGLQVVLMKSVVPRYEKKQPIDGLLFILKYNL